MKNMNNRNDIIVFAVIALLCLAIFIEGAIATIQYNQTYDPYFRFITFIAETMPEMSYYE